MAAYIILALAIGFIFAGAAVILLRALSLWLYEKSVFPVLLLRFGVIRPGESTLWLLSSPTAKRVILLSAGSILLCGLYGVYIEPYQLKVEHFELRSLKITSPLRIVFFTDTHSDPVSRLEERIPDAVRKLKPDLILFGGDAVNSDGGLPVFRKMMKALTQIAPTYAVHGNWESWWFPHLRLYEDTEVKILDNKIEVLSLGKNEIQLVLSHVSRGPNARSKRFYWGKDESIMAGSSIMPGADKEKFTVFLHHFPEVSARSLENGADLALSGDTHGGQVRLPFIGPLVKMRRFGKYFDVGVHKIHGGILYVSRGVGMEGGSAPRLRFLCPPEIIALDILPGR